MVRREEKIADQQEKVNGSLVETAAARQMAVASFEAILSRAEAVATLRRKELSSLSMRLPE